MNIVGVLFSFLNKGNKDILTTQQEKSAAIQRTLTPDLVLAAVTTNVDTSGVRRVCIVVLNVMCLVVGCYQCWNSQTSIKQLLSTNFFKKKVAIVVGENMCLASFFLDVLFFTLKKTTFQEIACQPMFNPMVVFCSWYDS